MREHFKDTRNVAIVAVLIFSVSSALVIGCKIYKSTKIFSTNTDIEQLQVGEYVHGSDIIGLKNEDKKTINIKILNNEDKAIDTIDSNKAYKIVGKYNQGEIKVYKFKEEEDKKWLF